MSQTEKYLVNELTRIHDHDGFEAQFCGSKDGDYYAIQWQAGPTLQAVAASLRGTPTHYRLARSEFLSV